MRKLKCMEKHLNLASFAGSVVGSREVPPRYYAALLTQQRGAHPSWANGLPSPACASRTPERGALHPPPCLLSGQVKGVCVVGASRGIRELRGLSTHCKARPPSLSLVHFSPATSREKVSMKLAPRLISPKQRGPRRMVESSSESNSSGCKHSWHLGLSSLRPSKNLLQPRHCCSHLQFFWIASNACINSHHAFRKTATQGPDRLP